MFAFFFNPNFWEAIMSNKKLLIIAFACALVFTSGLTLAAGQEQVQQQQQEQAYGRELMTEQEREQHRLKMRSAKTAEERQKIRTEQHERMKERAKERGMMLPDTPPVRGGGMGAGGRMGMGGGRHRWLIANFWAWAWGFYPRPA